MLTISEEDGAIVSIDWGWVRESAETPLLVAARDQLEAYFDGRLGRFNLPLLPLGTPFQQAVWQALLDIPFGQTRRYGDLARAIGTAPRAIGTACGRNPIPIVIPCHRVIGAGGGLGGYSGEDGVETKRYLLRLEGAHP